MRCVTTTTVQSSVGPQSHHYHPVMTELQVQLPSLQEDNAGLGDAPENLLWKPQNTEVWLTLKNILIKI